MVIGHAGAAPFPRIMVVGATPASVPAANDSKQVVIQYQVN
jgi:hypothetical protein